MGIETVAIETIRPDSKNVRRHGKRNLEAIAVSLKRFGQQKPIVVDRDGVVCAGNGTLEAARKLGWKQIDIVRTTLTGAELRAYAVADNRTAELAEWDSEALATLLADPEIGDVGFDPAELAEMTGGDDPLPKVLAETWQVVAECEDEESQRALYERLTAEGYTCRVLTL